MPMSSARLLLCALLGLMPAAAGALELRSVEVRGLTDEEMHDNVDDALSLQRLNPNRRERLTESRLAYLLRRAPGEVRGALEPFGHYEPTIATDVRREGALVDVVVTVDPGEPVRVTTRDLALRGPAASDGALMRRLERFRPREGQPFHHGVYEDGKAAMDRALAERGYFDAVKAEHRVTVDRGERSAEIALAWESGARYALGEATFEGHAFRPGLLEKLVPWRVGQPFDQAELLALQTSLAELDYFSAIDITTDPSAAGPGRAVPVRIALAPAKRSIYSAGIRYGTDSGLGLTAGLERRWVNDRGHKFRSLASVAERRTDLAAQYRIPAFRWLDGWYTLGASLREEQVDGVESQLVEVIGSRSGKLGDWTLTAAMNFRRERFEDIETGFEHSYSTLVYPSLLAQWARSDDVLYPRRAHGLTLELRGGNTALGSDIDFLQMRAEARWIRALGRRDRILLRAEAGTTISGDYASFPPSLRFHAGGDRSVRGYGYREIGEAQFDPEGRRFVVGGRHLVVASAEFERMFDRTWGAAVFVDAGDAFDRAGDLDLQTGIGVGLRWRSPVGPVRVDVAHGLGDDAQQSIRLHLNIGPDL
jgi:translocation and assembly module TamA